MGCEYLWIDSLCILQDSLEDWQTQSAVMGDIYKFAGLNLAALTSTSDYGVFIKPCDTRAVFGFRASFASLLSRCPEEKNSNGQECILLRGMAKLLWRFQSALPQSSASNATLFKRAWVYQKRSLARRTLAFAEDSMYWACHEGSGGEQPDWAVAGLESTGLRGLLHSVHDVAETARAHNQIKLSPQQLWAFRSALDIRWHDCVTSYSQCRLSRHTDKLVEISAVARELHQTGIISRITPARAKIGDVNCVAPSWSWASVEAPVQPRLTFNRAGLVPLARVLAGDVSLETDIVYGSIKAGWMRIRSNLNRVLKTTLGGNEDLVDEATGERLGFCPDTLEGYAIMESATDIGKVVWMPLTVLFAPGVARCTYLILIERELDSGRTFTKAGEKVYQRIGCGDFGGIPSLFRLDKSVLGLGTFPDTEVRDDQAGELAKDFRKTADGPEEFVLIWFSPSVSKHPSFSL
ncbi:MAG: hypothetical protein Q9222_002641 [Ikaeria aurantiellina]